MKATHWTERSIDDYLFSIGYDFVYQLERRMDAMGWIDQDLGLKMGLSKGRMSQILNNRGNVTLKTMIKCARALGLKVSVVAYDDEDKNNKKGPIPAEIFRLCWEQQGKPADMWDIQRASTSASVTRLRAWPTLPMNIHSTHGFPQEAESLGNKQGGEYHARGNRIQVYTEGTGRNSGKASGSTSGYMGCML